MSENIFPFVLLVQKTKLFFPIFFPEDTLCAFVFWVQAHAVLAIVVADSD